MVFDLDDPRGALLIDLLDAWELAPELFVGGAEIHLLDPQVEDYESDRTGSIDCE